MPDLYPAIDEIVEKYDYLRLDDCAHPVMKVDMNDGIYLVYKPVFDYFSSKSLGCVGHCARKLLLSIERPISRYYRSKIPFMSHIKWTTNYNDLLDIESKTLAEWKKRGIPCMDILERQDNSLVYSYKHAVNFKRLLLDGKNHETEYLQMLDIIADIRSVAKSENNPSLLHPDMLAKNFLYSFDDNNTLAIDPGLMIKDAKLEDIDCSINLFFLHDLVKYPNCERYSDLFLERLDRKDIMRLKGRNTPLRPDVILYFNSRNFISSLLRAKPVSLTYTFSDFGIVDRMIKRHI